MLQPRIVVLTASCHGLQGDVAGESQGMPSVQLRGLQVRLGPELRAMYPVVVNLGISGDVELNGAADPSQLRMTGVVNLESGEVILLSRAALLAFRVPNA